MIFIFNFWKVNFVFWVWDDDNIRFWEEKREDDQVFNLLVEMKMNKMNFLPVFELKTLIFELQHNITLSLEIKKGDNTEKIRTQEKKTEHTNIALSSLKLCVKIFTSCCLMQIQQQTYNTHINTRYLQKGLV